MKKIIISLIICVFASVFCFAQKNIQLHFVQIFNNQAIDTSQYYLSTQKDSLKISDIKCYISSITLEMEDGTIFQEKNSFHLLDLENPASLQFSLSPLPQKKVHFLRFNLGIDSLTSVSGALEGDLDPTNGMYWAWQSGYINFKIEGKSPSCKTRKNEFHFHVGGYMQPFYAIQKMKLSVEHIDNEKITIGMDWAKLFEEIPLSKQNSIMIPGKEAMQIAQWATKMFFVY